MLEDKIGALLEQKFHCSQIMMKVGMEALELEERPGRGTGGLRP